MDDKRDDKGISKQNIRGTGPTKDFDQLLIEPDKTSDSSMDDTHENLPNAKD
jgi:hypothetical protein